MNSIKEVINSSPIDSEHKAGLFVDVASRDKGEQGKGIRHQTLSRGNRPQDSLPAIPGREPARSQDICCPLPPSRQTASHRRPTGYSGFGENSACEGAFT